METWPSLLPNWQRGYSFAPNTGGVLRTQFSTGRARQRLVSNVRDDVFSVELQLTPSELVVFEHFVGVLCRFVDWFTGPYHDGAGTKTGALRLVGGAYQVRQLDNANLYRVTAQMEIQDRDIDGSDVLVAYLYPNTYDDYIKNLENAYFSYDTE